MNGLLSGERQAIDVPDVGLGAAAGVMLALAVSRWLAAFIVGVAPRDPVVLGGAFLVLPGVAVLAAYVPARRASRIDPLAALRSD